MTVAHPGEAPPKADGRPERVRTRLSVALALSSRLLGAGLQFLAGILVARIFPLELAGEYFTLVGASYVASAVLGIGLPWLAMAQVAGAGVEARDQDVLAWSLLLFSAGAVVVLGTIAGLGSRLVARLLGSLLLDRAVVLLGILLGGFVALTRTASESIKAAGHPNVGLLLDRSVVPALATVLVLLVGVTGTDRSRAHLHAIMLLAFGGAALVCVLFHAIYFRFRPGLPARGVLRELPGQYVIQLVDVSYFRLPVVLVGVHSLSSAASFGAAYSLTTVLNTLTYGLFAVYGPPLARAAAWPDRTQAKKILRGSRRLTAAIVVPVGVLLIIAARPLLQVYGADYRESANLLRILAVGTTVAGCFGLGPFVLAMTSRLWTGTLITGIGLVIVVLVGTIVPGSATAAAMAVAVAVTLVWRAGAANWVAEQGGTAEPLEG